MSPARGAVRPPVGGDRGTAGHTKDDTAIIGAAQYLGNCISCGSRIALVGGATTCPTCSAWRRWYSAHRIAAGFMREVSR